MNWLIVVMVVNRKCYGYYIIQNLNKNNLGNDSGVGKVQGSILGPVLCAIFVSPLADLENKLGLPTITIFSVE